MMSNEQMAELVLQHSREITALQESTKSAHHRIGENNKITASVSELAKSITEMTAEIKHLAKRVDTSIERIEDGQKAQGERIGEVEKAILLLNRAEKYIEKHEKRLEAIERAPAHKWDKLTGFVTAGIISAVVTYVMSRILYGG